MYQRILVPLDGSTRAEAILPHVEELVRSFDATIILATVVEAIAMPTAGALMTEPGDAVWAWEEARAFQAAQSVSSGGQQAEEYLAGVQRHLLDKGLRADKHVVFGGPVAKTIMQLADTENADLIALASHGHTGLAQVFYGSVAASILHRVDRPLLIVRSR